MIIIYKYIRGIFLYFFYGNNDLILLVHIDIILLDLQVTFG